MTVQEGPGYEPAPSYEVKPEQYPFAYRLMRHLDRNGAVVGFQAGEYRHGSCSIGGPAGADRVVRMWEQLHASEDEPEALGARIMERVGNLITFGEMFIPDKGGIQWSGYQRAGGVWVRQIGHYDIGTDSIIQRWDVIVRKTQ